MENKEVMEEQSGSRGRHYCVNIEDTEHPWSSPTITTEQIAELGGWDPSQGVIEIDLRENTERQLSPGEVVELRPGHGFCKKVGFKRGLHEGSRQDVELARLRKSFPSVESDGDWCCVRDYPLPRGWNRTATDAAFKRSPGHPAAAPYGIYVPAGLRIDDKTPSNYTEPAAEQPPFGGVWGVFSWKPTEWSAATEQAVGWSLVGWVRSFARRFAELN